MRCKRADKEERRLNAAGTHLAWISDDSKTVTIFVRLSLQNSPTSIVSVGEEEKKTQRVANVRKFAPEGGEKREGKERNRGERKREAKGSGGCGKRLSFSKDVALPSWYHRLLCAPAMFSYISFSLALSNFRCFSPSFFLRNLHPVTYRFTFSAD